MSDVENKDNVNDQNVDDQNKNNELKLEDFLEKFKDNEAFKNYISEAGKTAHAGIFKKNEELLKDLQKLKEFKNKSNEDEVVKLLTSGSAEDRAKAVEILTNDKVSEYQKLIEEKDAEINSYKEKEIKFLEEKNNAVISAEFKKSKIFENIADEAVDEFVLPNVFKNFKVDNDKIVYTGKELNKQGKPLNLDEFLVKFLEPRKFLLKEKNGSNLFSKTTESNSVTQSKSSYEDRLRNKGLIKD